MFRALIALATLALTAAAAPPCDGECGRDHDIDHISLLQHGTKLTQGAKVNVSFKDHACRMSMEEQNRDSLLDNPFERVWFFCRGKPFEQVDDEEAMVGLKRLNPMSCTEEMSLAYFCCAPYEEGLAFTRNGSVDLDQAQHPNDPAFQQTVPQGAETIVSICTAKTAASTIAEDEGLAESNSALECLPSLVTEEELKDTAGEIALQERIKYFVSQGLLASSIPTCNQTIDVCPCTGGPPPSVTQDFIDALDAKQEDSAILTETAGGNLYTGGNGNAFMGALMTTGSFTMKASGGV